MLVVKKEPKSRTSNLKIIYFFIQQNIRNTMFFFPLLIKQIKIYTAKNCIHTYHNITPAIPRHTGAARAYKTRITGIVATFINSRIKDWYT